MRWLLFCQIFVSVGLWAKELTIFDVRKNLTLSNTEKAYRDFYINGGAEQGLKAGSVILVERRVSLYDSFQNKSPGELMIPVAKLKVIMLDNQVSVARWHEAISRDNVPVLDFEQPMIGDKIRLDKVAQSNQNRRKTAVRINKPTETVEEPKTLALVSRAPDTTPNPDPNLPSDQAPAAPVPTVDQQLN